MRTSFAAMILCILMALMVAATWQMWMNPVIDSGREMNTPLRLLNGESLYSQVYYLYGPVAPYLNAGLYALFGSRLGTLYWAGIIGSLLLILSVFHLARRFMGPLEAMMPAVAVLLLCVFKESGNTIFPYSFAVLYGTLFGTFALILLVRYIDWNHRGSLLASGILSGLAFCCKTEFGLAVIASLLAVIVTAPRGQRLRVCRIALGGFSVFPVLVGVLLFTRISPEYFFRDAFVLPGFLPDELVYYNQLKLGFKDPGRTIREMISAVAVLFGCAGLFSLASIRLSRNSGEIERTESGGYLRWLGILTAASWGLLLIHRLVFGSRWDLNPLRALPVLFLGMICYYAVSHYRSCDSDLSTRALLVVTVYALAILARIITRVPAGGGYGAGLLPVPLILFIYMAITDLGPFRVPVSVKPYRRRAVTVFLAVALIATSGVIAFRYRNRTNHIVKTPRGNFSVHPAIGSAMEQALSYIARNSNPGEYILSLPEGTSLNFLADRPVPLRYEILTPGFLDRSAEIDAIRKLQEKKVRYVFLFNRPTSEFGAKVFGRDYYRTLMGWIESNYELDAVFGEGVTPEVQIGNPVFFIKCYRRKSWQPAVEVQ